MKFRIAKKIMTGRSSYNRRCQQLRPLQKLEDGSVFVPSWDDIDRVRRAAHVFFRHVGKNVKAKRAEVGSITPERAEFTVPFPVTEEDARRGIGNIIHIGKDGR